MAMGVLEGDMGQKVMHKRGSGKPVCSGSLH